MIHVLTYYVGCNTIAQNNQEKKNDETFRTNLKQKAPSQAIRTAHVAVHIVHSWAYVAPRKLLYLYHKSFTLQTDNLPTRPIFWTNWLLFSF